MPPSFEPATAADAEADKATEANADAAAPSLATAAPCCARHDPRDRRLAIHHGRIDLGRRRGDDPASPL